jgi:hypothetical protein
MPEARDSNASHAAAVCQGNRKNSALMKPLRYKAVEQKTLSSP